MAWSADKVRKFRGTTTNETTTSGGGWTPEKIRALRQPAEEKRTTTTREEDDSSLLPSVRERAATAKQKAVPRVEKRSEPAQNLAMLNRVEPGDTKKKAPSLTDIHADMSRTAQKQDGKLGIGKTLGYGAMMGVNEADAGLTKITKDVYNVSAAPLRPWNVTIGGKKVNVNPINQASNAVQKYVGKPLRDLVRKQEWLPSWMKPADESLFDGSRDPIAEGLQRGQDYFSNEGMGYQQKLEGGTALENTVGRATAEITKMAPQIAMALMSGGATAPGMVSGETAMAAQAALRPGLAGLSGATMYEAGKDLSMMAPFGVQALGGYLRDAESKGATPAQQWASALPSASLEVVTEMIPFGFFKKTLGVSDDLVQAASKAGAKKAQRYFGELAKAEVFNAATQIVQEIGINPFTAAIEKAVYNPDMAWTGENGVFDAKETWETAKVTGVMSLMMAALGLPFSAPGHARALRMLQQPESVTSQDVELLQEEIRAGVEQTADPLQNVAAQMADQIMPETAQAEQVIEQEQAQQVQQEQTEREQIRATIEAIAEPMQEETDTTPPALAQEQSEQVKTATDTPAPAEVKTEAVNAPEKTPTQKAKAPSPQSDIGRSGKSVLKKWSQNEWFGVDEKGPGHPFTTGFRKLYEAGRKSVEMEGDPSKNRFRLMQEVERGYTEQERDYMKPWFQDTAYNAGRDDAMTAKPKKTEAPAAAVEAKQAEPVAPVAEKAAASFEKSKVRDDSGKLVTVYRGEYGPLGNALNTRLGSITFAGTEESALTYANEPNNANDTVVEPRVIAAELDIQNPIFDDKEDPFVDMGSIAEKIGPDAAKAFAIKHDQHITGTDSWYENFSEYTSVEELLTENPDALNELYMFAYPLLDDPDFIKAAKAKGYDGAIHMSNGDTSDDVEYRVFSPEQVRVLSTKREDGTDVIAQETAQAEAPAPAVEPVSPTEEKLAKLDEKLDRLIEAVGGKLEVEGSVSDGNSEPVSSEQLEVEGSGTPDREEPAPVSTTGERRESEQVGDKDGADGGKRVRPDGTGSTRKPSVSTSNGKPSTGSASEVNSDGGRTPGIEGISVQSGNVRIADDDVLFEGGEKTRYKNNVEAIRLMKKIEEEGRSATVEEQRTLLKYVGWGGIPGAFDKTYDREQRKYVPNPKWEKEYNELLSLLTEQEYKEANSSTQNAHYTHPMVIKAMYAMAKRLGFNGGTILEPSAGIGHFIGLVPDEFIRSRFLAVEKDSITGRIAKLLYPQSDVRVSGFENVSIPDDYFDMAISNVPFGDIRIHDNSYKDGYITSRIHNYFFVKALDKVKPGGAVMFITSSGTLGANDLVAQSIRRHLYARADLVAAFKLPGDAFKKNAGTEVTTDIIILRKRIPGEMAGGEQFLNVVEKTIPGSYSVFAENEYFQNNPQNVLGKYVPDKLYPSRLGLESVGDLSTQLETATKSLPQGVINPVRGTVQALTAEQEVSALNELKDGAYFISNGKVSQKRGSVSIVVDVTGVKLKKLTALVKLKEAVKAVITSERTEAADAIQAANRKRMTDLYDEFVLEYGTITGSKPNNISILREDPESFLISALEIPNKKEKTVVKSDFFTKKGSKKYERPTTANTPEEALAISLYEKGSLDLSRISELLDLTEEKAAEALRGYIYKNPSGTWETADEYLSGNVRKKLLLARQATELDESYQQNVDALEKVQPERLSAASIDVKFGATWVPPEVVSSFIADLLQVSTNAISTSFSKIDSKWKVSASYSAAASHNNQRRYAYLEWSAIDIISNLLEMKTLEYTYKDNDGKLVNDAAKTAALREKAEEIKNVFSDWVWRDKSRRDLLEDIYNNTFNAIRNRSFYAPERAYPGMSDRVKLMPHQREAVERVILGGNTLLAHGVGFGKTYPMLVSAMELKRMGLAQKPMFIVPNNKLSDFANDLKTMYPQAKALIADPENMTPEYKKDFLSRIATNDWDVVIMQHSSFDNLDVLPETQAQHIREQLLELEEAILSADTAGDKTTVKKLANKKDALETELNVTLAAKRSPVLAFEELGVDYLYVDESHEYKNLRTHTRFGQVKGISTGSVQKTDHFLMVANYIRQLHGGTRGLVFATGTPVSNTLNELHTIMKYMRPDVLKEAGVYHFDAWMSVFGNIASQMEIKHDGTFKSVDRFRNFVNVAELMKMFKEFADIRMDSSEVELVRPDLDTGKPIIHELTPHPLFEKYMKSIVERMKKIKGFKNEKGADNALTIMKDAKRATTDMQLIQPAYGDHADTKSNACVKTISEIYQSTADRKATQMVFLGEGRSNDPDESDPTGKKKILRFDSYKDIYLKLVKAGVPANEIALMHNYTTDAKKEKLFEAMNNGDVRVLIGSYAAMGTGLNVQERLYAIHELDVPWKPSDIEQSEGRMIRQGNQHIKWGIPVQIHRYIVKGNGSFDAFMWQMQETKLAGQRSLYRGEVRTVTAEDEDVEQFRALKALATGNPLVQLRVDLEQKLNSLRMQRVNFINEIIDAQDKLAKLPASIEAKERTISKMREDVTRRKIPETFFMKVSGKAYDKKKEAVDAIINATTKAIGSPVDTVIGEYAGFNIVAPKNNVDPLHLVLAGSSKHEVQISGHPDGSITSIQNALGKIESVIAGLEESVERERLSKTSLEESAKRAFPKEAELKETLEQFTKVDNDLAEQQAKQDAQPQEESAEDEDDVPDEFKGETPPDVGAYIASEGGYITLPGGNPKRGPDGLYQFADPEIEAQHETAKLTPPNVLDKVKVWAADFALSSSRTYKDVDPTIAKNSNFISAMVRYVKLKALAGGRAVRIINDILKREGAELTKEEYNLFNRYILLRDLKEEVKAEHPLPGKWTPAAVEAYLAEVESLLNDNTREAVKRRDGYIKKIKDEYIEAMDALGWNVKSRFKRENYFRHQVLEYAQAKITGGGKRINVKRSRGWLKQRHGSTMLINEDYLQAEYEVMASMIHDAEVAKMLKDIGNKYDIKATLKRRAKAIDEAKLQELYDADIASGNVVKRTVGKGDAAMEIERSVTEDTLMNFNRKMAIAFGRLSKAASNGALWDGDGEWSDVVMSLAMDDRAEDTSSRVFRYLAELADQNDDTAITARTILKAISDKKKAVEALIGKKTEWNDIIPEGYVEFQPIIGKHFYAANAVTENLANALLTGNLKEIGLSDMKVQKIMTMGSPFNSFVIPAEYVTTMEDVYGDIKNGAIDNMVAAFMKGWKIWNLHLNPWRFVKYNLRNATGDFERLLGAAGVRGVNPVYAKRAAKELFDAMRYNKFTKELVEFREMGGMQDNLYVQEIAAINDAKIFNEFSSKKRTVMDKILFVPKTWDEFSSNTTEYRENILRYAAYLYYRQDLTATGGKPTFYGASLRARIDGLSSTEEKAYQLSKDAIGAYDEVSETGRWIRRYLIPFWSFQETNLKYYKRLVENTIKDDTVTEAFGKHAARSLGITVKLSAKAFRKIGTIAMRVAFFSLALLLWNRLAMGDEDDDLDEDIRNNPHITLGRLPNGDVLYFSRLGTLSDLLEWFNLNSVPNEIADIAEDRSTFAHLAEEMAKGPVNKLVNGMAPYLKIPAELLSGKQFYPDAFRPRNIRDLGKYAADQAGVGKEFDRLTGKPVKESYAKAWMDSVIYRSDPEQTAYYSVLDLKDKYRKNVLGKSSGTGFNNDAKSKALYYYKLSLKYGDKPKADKYLNEYFDNGGTERGLNQSLATLEPMYSLNEAERGGFYEWLRPEERDTLKKAYKYYTETLGGGQ